MPPPTIPKQEVIRMLRDGVSQAQIVEYLRTEYGLIVKPQAIGMIRARAGLPTTLARHHDLLPWRVAEEHARLHVPAMLRLESRKRAGETLTPKNDRTLAAFLSRLKDGNMVIHYEENDPTGQGWYYFPREAYDRDIIRDPQMVK